MSKSKIIQFGNQILRQKSREITLFHSGFHKFLNKLTKILIETPNAAGLAAPQIGESKSVSIIIWENKTFELINPRLLYQEGEQIDYEGCLSFSGYSGLVKRAKLITVEYADRNGKIKKIEAEGFLARCLLHEIDHLKGILYIDHVEESFLYHDKTNEKINIETIRQLSNQST
ncbi:MAG: peptide deformylase [Spirochaetales bacterium]|nr:peptide deformylase [Spirochaetales bacterium]